MSDRAIPITKMSGSGNDFILVDNRRRLLDPDQAAPWVRAVCRRALSVGADGVILLEADPRGEADFAWRFFNSDGSEAEMCGNGVRCFAKFVYERGLTDRTELAIETGAGLIRPNLTVVDGQVPLVRVDMGEPRLTRGEIPMTGDSAASAQGVQVPLPECRYTATCVSMGNPHCVIKVDEICDTMVHEHGPQIECHDLFPRKTNVEFVQVLGPDAVRMRVWERGAGETMACGTGACATGVAAILGGHCGRALTVHLRGGDLQIEWSEADNHVYMTGPAAEVCEGTINEELLAKARA